MTMPPSQSSFERERRRGLAAHNVSLGWCPCGDERDDDCECFGVNALAIAQGLSPVSVIRTEEAEYVSHESNCADPPGPAYTYGHRDVQVGVTDDAMPIERCERCGRQRIGIYPEDPCPGRRE